LLVVLGALTAPAWGKARFPPPQFNETNHQVPKMNNIDHLPRDIAWEYVDLAVLFGALTLATILAIRGRSRGWMLGLTVFSVAYFGFYREGCVCPIGATQNVALGLADPSYAIPLVVIAFFMLPLIFALFFGRVFCGGVCPLGAIQDLVLVRPVKVPGWLDRSLGVIPYLYLASGVLFAVTGTAFIICEYDPFVGFFRFDGNTGVLIFGGLLLATGMFVGRPYCRFLCPYSVLLRHLSRLSMVHLKITPDDCIQCTLCEEACPFGAIDTPSTTPEEAGPFPKVRLIGLLALTPVLIAAFGLLAALGAPAFTGWHPEAQRLDTWMDGAASIVGGRKNRDVLLGRARGDWGQFIVLVSDGDARLGIPGGKALMEKWDQDRRRAVAAHAAGQLTDDAYRKKYAEAERNYRRVDTALGQMPDGDRAVEAAQRVVALRKQLFWGGWIVGGLVGLVIGARLIRFAVYRNRTDYEANKASCLSCNRCLMHCPRERARLGIVDAQVALTTNGLTPSEGGS
jgi:polyferredoxin